MLCKVISRKLSHTEVQLMKRKKIEKLISQRVNEELEKRLGSGRNIEPVAGSESNAGAFQEDPLDDWDMLPPDGQSSPELRGELQQDLSMDSPGAS